MLKRRQISMQMIFLINIWHLLCILSIFSIYFLVFENVFYGVKPCIYVNIKMWRQIEFMHKYSHLVFSLTCKYFYLRKILKFQLNSTILKLAFLYELLTFIILRSWILYEEKKYCLYESASNQWIFKMFICVLFGIKYIWNV